MSKIYVRNAPYFDDFSEDKQFYQVLFRPTYAVQARELNQLQSIQQNQISKFGKHMFVDGSMVIPGSTMVDSNWSYIKVDTRLSSLMNSSEELEIYWLGKEIICNVIDSTYYGVKALVVGYEMPNEEEPYYLSLLLKYISANSVEEQLLTTTGSPITNVNTVTLTGGRTDTDLYSGQFIRFYSHGALHDGTTFKGIAKILTYEKTTTLATLDAYLPNLNLDETLSYDCDIYLETSGEINTFTRDLRIEREDDTTFVCRTIGRDDATGICSVASVREGVFFAHEKFVRCSPQTIIIAKDDETPTCRIGLRILETAITPEDDPTLTDNAQGTENYAAPGAHRLKIDLDLIKLSYPAVSTEDEEDFIELIRIESGKITKKTDNSQYAVFSKELARRTYDESGDYTIKPFPLSIEPFTSVWSKEELEYDIEEQAKQASIETFERKNSAGVLEAAAHPVSNVWRPGASDAELTTLMNNRLALIIDPGKAYIKGFEIETLDKNYVSIETTNTYNTEYNKTIPAGIGNYILVKDVIGLPDIINFSKINLKNSAGTTLGTARARSFKPDAIGGCYRLYLFDIQITTGYSLDQVQSVSDLVTTPNFTANIVDSNYEMTGTINFLVLIGYAVTITGSGTTWVSDDYDKLEINDIVQCISDEIKYKFKVTATPTTDTTLSTELLSAVDKDGNAVTSLPPVAAGSFSYIYCNLFEPGDLAVYWLPRSGIRTLTDDIGRIGTEYSVFRKFTAVTAISTTVTFSTLAGINEEFDTSQFASDLFTLVDNTTGEIISVSGISYNFINDYKSVELTSGSISGGTAYSAILPVKKKGWDSLLSPGTTAQRKTSTSGSVVYTNGTTPKLSELANVSEIVLNRADVYEIVSILHSTDGGSTSTDLIDDYELISGQTDSHYGLSKIRLKSGKKEFITPGQVAGVNESLTINYSFFTRSGNKNLFCINSYLNQVEEHQYISPNSGVIVDLHDAVDFRPAVGVTGEFSGTGFAGAEFPVADIELSYTYYLPRKDKVYLDQNGKFRVVRGIPDISPVLPPDPSMGMVLYELELNPFAQTNSDIKKTFRENKRYTMRDIGKLERRIETLEYYTTLNLLEKQTADMKITDNYGLDRFKNGFFVDQFKDQSVCNPLDGDQKCAIDTDKQEARPQFSYENVALEETISNNVDRLARGYTKTGDLVTLPYTNTSLISQLEATGNEGVNPFDTWTYMGKMKLTPDQDEWKETTKAPDFISDQTTQFQNLVDGLNNIGTIYSNIEYGDPVVTKSPPIKGKKKRSFAPRGTPHVLTPDLLKNLTSNNPFLREKAWEEYNNPPRVITQVTKRITNVSQEVTADVTTINASLGEITNYDMGERVIDTSFTPYMRAVNIFYFGENLQPGKKLYAFFDDINATQYIKSVNQNELVQMFPSNSSISATDPLIPNEKGQVTGLLQLPGGVYRTGTRKLVLTSDPLNKSGVTPDSSATATFRAQGLTLTMEKAIVSTRLPEISIDKLEDQIIATNEFSLSTQKKDIVCYYDPLAQTFTPGVVGGCFLTKLDLYFAAKPTNENIPIYIEIREAVNGYPGKAVVPFTRVSKFASQVNVSTNASIATTFTFDAPAYVQQTEYAIVIMSPSNDYKLWFSKIGGTSVINSNTVTKNVYAGAFFRSQNASGWEIDGYTDLTFNLYRAEFDTSATGCCTVVNEDISTVELDTNPFFSRSGSTTVYVRHPNHGLVNGSARSSRVVFTGFTPDETFANNITTNELLNTSGFEPSNITLDGYTIEVTTTPDLTGNFGSRTSETPATETTINASRNIAVDAVNLLVSELRFPTTSTVYKLSTTSSKCVDGTQVPFNLLRQVEVESNRLQELNEPCMVVNALDEATRIYVDGLNIADTKSFQLAAFLNSSVSTLSPVIDLQNVSATCISNRLDYPALSTRFIPTVDEDVLCTSKACDFSATYGSIVMGSFVQTIGEAWSTLQTSDYIQISGATASNGTDATPKFFRISSVVITRDGSGVITGATIFVDQSYQAIVGETNGSATIAKISRYRDETSAHHNTGESRYISGRMNTKNPSTSIKVLVDLHWSVLSIVDVYYRTLLADDSSSFDDVLWVKMDANANIPYPADIDEFNEFMFDAVDLKPFIAVEVKLVFNGLDTSNPPRAKNLRVIALDV